MHYSPYSEAAQTGDYVGVESCIDLRNAEDFEAYARDCERSYERRRKMRKAEGAVDRRREVREFPPPITYLARTDNLPSLMPWVMKRYHTADGRLVIRKERVRHHEYFRAHRADGRLTLQLIPLDVDDCNDDGDDEESCSVGHDDVQSCTDLDVDDSGSSELKIKVEEGNKQGEGSEEEDKEEVVDVEDEIKSELGAGAESTMAAPVMVSSLSMSALCMNDGVNSSGGFKGGNSGLLTSASASCLAASGGGGGNKCYGFHSLRSSSASSLFHLPLPALRPVIS